MTALFIQFWTKISLILTLLTLLISISVIKEQLYLVLQKSGKFRPIIFSSYIGKNWKKIIFLLWQSTGNRFGMVSSNNFLGIPGNKQIFISSFSFLVQLFYHWRKRFVACKIDNALLFCLNYFYYFKNYLSFGLSVRVDWPESANTSRKMKSISSFGVAPVTTHCWSGDKSQIALSLNNKEVQVCWSIHYFACLLV